MWSVEQRHICDGLRFVERLGAIGFKPYFRTNDPRTSNSYEFLPFSELLNRFISLSPLSIRHDMLAGLEPELIRFRRRIEAQDFGSYDPTSGLPFFLKAASAAFIIPEICRVFDTKIISVVRPLEDIERTRLRRGWPALYGRVGAEVIYRQLSLVLGKGDYPHTTIEYNEFLSSPSRVADKLVQFGKLRPAADAIEKAIRFVKPPPEQFDGDLSCA